MRLLSLPVIAIFMAALSFGSLTQASGHKDKFHNGKGPHHERHYDGDNQKPFRELKREKMQRYRNNEMVHGCIESAQSKRDIGRCIKEHKAERKAYKKEHHQDRYEERYEQRKSDREYLREDMQKYREEQREQRRSERDERHEYLRSLSPEEREAKRQEYRKENREYRENHRDERRDYYKNRRNDDDDS